MSTKTSIKRIALVAVSALGFGLFSGAPAKAAPTTVVTTALTSPTATVVVGSVASTTFTVDTGTTSNATDTITYSFTIQTKPASSQLAKSAATSSSTLPTLGVAKLRTGLAGATYSQAAGTDTLIDTVVAAELAAEVRGGIAFIPDVAGTYVIRLTATTNVAAGNDAGPAVNADFTVTALNAANSASAPFLTSATTVDTPATAASTLALVKATPALAPGVSFTPQGALGDTSVASMTVPASTVVGLELDSTGTFATGTLGRLTLNGVQHEADKSISSAGLMATFTAPATAGTYSAVLTISGSLGSFDPAVTQSLSFTLVVGAASSELPEFGISTAVAPAAAVVAVGVTKGAVSGRVGVPVGFALNFSAKNVNANNNASAYNTALSAANLRYTLASPSGAAVSVMSGTSSTAVATTTLRFAGDVASLANAATQTTPTISSTLRYFTPASAGTFTLTVWHDADNDALRDAGEAFATESWVINADALPSITFTKYGSNSTKAQAANGGLGQLVKVSLRNSSSAWALAANETLVITGPSGTTFDRVTDTCSDGTCDWADLNAGTFGSVLTLDADSFNSNGDAWFNIGNTTAEGGSFTVSAVISGGTGAGATGSFAFTVVDDSKYNIVTGSVGVPLALADDIALTNVNAGLGVSGLSATTTTPGTTNLRDWTIRPGVAQTVSARAIIGDTANNNARTMTAIFTDSEGLVTGMKGAQYNINALTPLLAADLTATTSATFSVAIPATTGSLAVGSTIGTLSMTATTYAATVRTITIKTATAVPSVVLTNPASATATSYTFRAAVKSSNTVTATVTDQFGNVLVGQAVNAQVTSGRNVQTLPTALVTDSKGQVTFTVADTYTGTALTSDTITFTAVAVSPVSGTVTIDYSTYNPVSTIEVTGGASEDEAPEVTYSYISTGTSGASASAARVTMTAVLKDANGATLPAGIPVTWAISGLAGTSAIYVDPTTGYNWATSYTDANGKAVTYVYAWATGTVSVTATAGAVTSATAGKINFANAAADARVVSATVNGNVITAKVVDRYGNAVEGVSLTAVRNSGVGYFQGSASSGAVGTTNANGTVDFIMTGGAANVTVKTTTLNFGQTSSAAAQVNGTAITATSIGASLSPAGVQSVTVDVTANDPATDSAAAAADAAAEAIDAANAATDAANLAAEAADAATVAAEEARDAADAATAAVEELATQVATLMAALKAQITTLANTVAKIAKKVRA